MGVQSFPRCSWLPGIDHSRYRHLDPSNRSEDTVDARHGHRAGGSRNLSFVPRSCLIEQENERSPNANGMAYVRRCCVCFRFIVRRNHHGSTSIVSNVRRKCENPCSSSGSTRPLRLSASIRCLTLAHQWVALQRTSEPCNSDVGHFDGF